MKFRSVLPLILGLLLPTQALAKSGAAVLNMLIGVSGVSNYQLRAAAHLWPKDPRLMKIKDLVVLRNHVLGPRSATAINRQLKPYGLRLALTAEELDFFISHDHLPPLSGSSYVDALNLPSDMRDILEQNGVQFLDDAEDLTVEELRQIPGLGWKGVKKLVQTFAAAGFPLAENAIERESWKRTHRPSIRSLGLSVRTANSMSAIGVVTMADLKRLTVKRMETIEDLGQVAIAATVAWAKERGIQIWDDALEQALQEKTQLDLSLSIVENVRSTYGDSYDRASTLLPLLAEMKIHTIGDILKFDQRLKDSPMLRWKGQKMLNLCARVRQAQAAHCEGQLMGMK